MKNMKNLYITFTVSVSDSGYYTRDQGEATTTITVPDELLDSLNYGDVLKFLAAAALLDYRQKHEPQPDDPEPQS